MRDEPKDELDSILDGALRDYSNRQSVGLEWRVIARLHSTSSMSRSRWWIGWALIPVALAVIALVVNTASHERPKVQPQPSVARVVQLPAPPPSVPVIAKAAPKSAKAPRPKRVPEPETLTPGERALLRFARRDPEQARELFADSGQIKELTIEPLKIEALP